MNAHGPAPGGARRRDLLAIPRLALRAAVSLPGRIVITVVLLGVVALQIDWDTVGDALAGADWWLFAAAVALIACSMAIAAVRWHWLVRAAALPARLSQTLRAFAAGTFANNLLPSGFGGDLVRAWYIAAPGRDLARAIVSVFADRASALICSLLLAWIALAIAPGKIPVDVAAVLAAVSAGGVAAAALALLALRRRQLLARFVPDSLEPWVAEVGAVLRAYRGKRRLAVRVVVVGVAFQAVVVVALWLIGETIGAGASLALLAVTVPLVLISTLLPISIAGFGVREGAFVVLLGQAGVSAADATLVSLLSVAATSIASLPGGPFLVVGSRGSRVNRAATLSAPGDRGAARR